MAHHVLFVGREVSINLPETAVEWQLYPMPGADQAARSLAGALKRALMSGCSGYADERFVRYMLPVMERYARFGALDTEPRWIAADILHRFVGDRP